MKTEITTHQNQLFNYSYGIYLPNALLALAFIGIGIAIKFGMNAFYFNVLWIIPSLLLVIVCIGVFIPTEILQLDFLNNRYRIGVKVFSKIYGSWHPIGPVKYLSIVRVTKRIALSDNSVGLNQKDDLIEECRLRLFIKAGKHLTIDEYQTKSSAIYIAQLIAKGMNLRILDATLRPPIFLE